MNSKGAHKVKRVAWLQVAEIDCWGHAVVYIENYSLLAWITGKILSQIWERHNVPKNARLLLKKFGENCQQVLFK